MQCSNNLLEVYGVNFFRYDLVDIGIFMDDFSVFGEVYENCLHNLEDVLKRCKETNLVLIWEKCHFMV